MFPGKNTYTCLFFITKKSPASIRYCVNETAVFPKSFHYEIFNYSQLNANLGWKLNAQSLTNLYESVGIPLGDYCQTRHGIATLANKVYVFHPKRREGRNFVFEKQGVEYRVEQAICRRIVNSNKFNSEIQLESAIEQVIYPYRINTAGKIEVIDEDTMRLRFPLAYSYLVINRRILEARDKGHIEKYQVWYAFGRTQSLVMPRYKLFFPKIANKQLNCIICDEAELLLYNGISLVSNNLTKLQILKRIMGSSLFWEYITLNSKPYSSGYFSLNGVSIKHFGIPRFSTTQIEELLSITDRTQIDLFLKNFYE